MDTDQADAFLPLRLIERLRALEARTRDASGCSNSANDVENLQLELCSRRNSLTS
jgi:hypothetical protein